MSKSKKQPINREHWPKAYPLVELDGKAVLPRDFFPTTSASQLDMELAERTVHFRPYFEPSAVASGIVDKAHACGSRDPKNVATWLEMVQQDITGKRLRERMKSGWNNALALFMRTCGGDFAYNGHEPTTQADVQKILFSDELGLGKMTEEGGNLEILMALVFKWGYYLTMQSCSSNWGRDTTVAYIQESKYNVVLGDECVGRRALAKHGMVRIGLKLCIGSFHAYLRVRQAKHWGVVFEGRLKIDEKDSKYEVVDIGEYLPATVKRDMCRKSDTRFMVRRVWNVDKRKLLQSKVAALYSWAETNGMNREDVYDAWIKMAEGGMTEGEDSSEEDERGQDNAGGSGVKKSKERSCSLLTKRGVVPETVHEMNAPGQRPGTIMAPRRRPPPLGFRYGNTDSDDMGTSVTKDDEEMEDDSKDECSSESSETLYDKEEDDEEVLCSFFEQKGKENEANSNASRTKGGVSQSSVLKRNETVCVFIDV